MPRESFAPHKLFARLATIMTTLKKSLPDEQKDALIKNFRDFFICVSLLDNMENLAVKRQECSEVTVLLYDLIREVKRLKNSLADTPLLATSYKTSVESSECSALSVSSLSRFQSGSSSSTTPEITEILEASLRPTTQLPRKHTIPKPKKAPLEQPPQEEPSAQSITQTPSLSEGDNETDSTSFRSFGSSCDTMW